MFYKVASLSELNSHKDLLGLVDDIIKNENDALRKVKEIYYKGKAQNFINKSDDAIITLKKAIKLYSKSEKEKKIKDDDIIAKSLILLAEIYTNKGKLTHAILQYRRIISTYPFENFVDKAEFKTAESYFKKGSKAMAKKLLNKFIKNFQDSKYLSDAKNLLGKL